MVASSTIHIWIWENSSVGGNLVSSPKRWKEFHSLARKPYLISSYAYFDGVGLTNIVPSIIVLRSQGVSFTKFEDHLNDVDSPWHRETFFSTKLNGIAIGTHKSCATHFRNSCFNPWISLALWVPTLLLLFIWTHISPTIRTSRSWMFIIKMIIDTFVLRCIVFCNNLLIHVA